MKLAVGCGRWVRKKRGTAPFRARRPRTRVSCWIVTMRSFWHNQIQRLVLFSAYERVFWGLWIIKMYLSGQFTPSSSEPSFLHKISMWRVRRSKKKKKKKAIFSRIHRFQHTSYADTVWKWLWGDVPCARDDKQLISLWQTSSLKAPPGHLSPWISLKWQGICSSRSDRRFVATLRRTRLICWKTWISFYIIQVWAWNNQGS